MDERWRLLRAIEAEPDDDVVRLVFADWLEENGEADRSRFIRMQCEHHRLYGPRGTGGDLGRRRELEREIDGLLKKYREEWTAGLPDWARDEPFVRGFLRTFQMTGRQFLDFAARLRAAGPLDILALRFLRNCEGAVFASEHLGGVSRLWVEGAQLTDEGIRALASSPHLSRARQLGLGRSVLGDSRNVNRLTDDSALTLAGADNLPALVALDLSGYKKVGAAGVRALVESERRAALEELNVSGCTAGPALGELMAGPTCRLTRLVKLMANAVKLGEAGLRRLAEAPALSKLRVLWLAQNKITDRGAASFAGAAFFPQLMEIDLWQNKITDAGARAVLDSPGLSGVRRLELGENRDITNATAEAILSGGRPWEKVGLEGTRVSDALRRQIEELCRRNRGA